MIYAEFKKTVDTYPDKTAIIYNDYQCTYSELDNHIHVFADDMKKVGIGAQNKIVICLKNSTVFAKAFLSVNSINAIAVPLSHKIPTLQFLYYINLLMPKAIICDLNRIKEIEEVYSGILFAADYQDNKIFSFRDGTYTNADDIEEKRSDYPEIAEILFTSGTTGIPKGIMLSNENVLENIKGILAYLNLLKEENFLIIKPLHHSSSLNGELLLGLISGKTVILTNKLLSSRVIGHLIAKYCINVAFATPSLLRYFLEMDKKNIEEIIKTLRILHFYGAPLPEHILDELVKKYPNIEVIYSYGLTEASPRVTFIKKADLILKPRSSGVALCNVELKIVDADNDQNLGIGEIGEICVRGKNIMQGYYGNKVLSDTVIKNGWLKTGDLGYLDKDGYLYHKGRKDDLIIKGGINIYPAEIENIIYEIPGVQDALVVGEENSIYGSKVVAYIVTEGETSLSESVVNKFILTKLEPIKCPDRIEFVDTLNITESGKIKRAYGG